VKNMKQKELLEFTNQELLYEAKKNEIVVHSTCIRYRIYDWSYCV